MSKVQQRQLRLLWLELTHKCNLECVHCYTSSSPGAPHGRASAATWHRLLSEAAALGVETVCFIGGELTLNPELSGLLDHAHDLGIQSEVFTNLIRVSDELWDCFVRNSVCLATSIYSVDPREHDRVTTRGGSHRKTTRNMTKARELGLTVRAGAIEVNPSQGTNRLTTIMMEQHGIEVRVDRHRKLGRDYSSSQDFSQLCGNCSAGSAVVDPDGEVFPCIMSRWLACGNVHESSLGSIVRGGLTAQQEVLDSEFVGLRSANCAPNRNPCMPACNPATCVPGCLPTKGCPPSESICPPAYHGPCPPTCSPPP